MSSGKRGTMRDSKEIRNHIWSIRNLGYAYAGYIKLPGSKTCTVVWSENEMGWEHVSVAPKHKYVMPTWDDMCFLKDVFFTDDEEAYQIHPKKSDYVNIKDNCLHLWRPREGVLADLLGRGEKNG